MQSQLITCMAGDFVVYHDVSVVHVRIASNIGNRKPRDFHCRWSQEPLDKGEFHGYECPEREVKEYWEPIRACAMHCPHISLLGNSFVVLNFAFLDTYQ